MEWLTGLYGRVSTDSREQQESVKAQEEALIQYARDNGFAIAGYYFDEGFSGTDFNRPAMERLKNDIENKKINLIIVKDLSRIGRNNTATLVFLDYLGTEGIRLISINDGYDNQRCEDDLIGIKTWFNERYSKDLSQKIRFALKHKKSKGEYLTAFPPYGYMKSACDRNKLEVDYSCEGVIRRIFKMYIEGYGFSKIASTLQKEGISNPSESHFYGRKSNRWNWTTIRNIITNPVYTGCTVQQKYSRRSFKDRQVIKNPESQWIRVEGTHIPIINRDVFETAQQVLKNRKQNIKYRSGVSGPHLFTSILYCHDCGSPMYYKKAVKYGAYRCGTYVKYGALYCSSHYVGEDELVEIVSYELRNIIRDNVDMKKICSELFKVYLNNSGKIINDLNCVENEKGRCVSKLETLYHDRLNKTISEELFIKFKQEIDDKISTLDVLKVELIEKADAARYNNSFDNFCRGIESMVEFNDGLSRYVLELLVRKIEVCSDGGIIINFAFTL
jgi:Site-specific recombinases, DNA invertase Pin homologs